MLTCALDRQAEYPDPLSLSHIRARPTNVSHTDYLNDAANRLLNTGARNVRRDQEQVNPSGIRVGTNRPDLPFARNGKRYYIEVEGRANPRGAEHMQRIRANDPDGVVMVILVD